VRFLLDESVDPHLGRFLKAEGHDVAGIVTDHPASLPDSDVLAIARREARILITRDRDFGELVFAKHQPHAGVILLRLGSAPPLAMAIARLSEVLTDHAPQFNRFIVVTRDRIRVRE
jgi:predicted nuclease of predicted toxin-antitoxin system